MGTHPKLRSSFSLEEMDSNLKAKYRVSVFDIAYLLAISLNDDFLPQAAFGLRKKEAAGIRNILIELNMVLRNKRKRLKDYLFLDDVIDLINDKIEQIELELRRTSRPPGLMLSEKAKLILLWTQMLFIGKTTTYIDKDLEPYWRNVERFSWSDLTVVLNWFYIRLEGCTYSHYFQPNLNQLQERKNAKSSREKNDERYERQANTFIWEYRRRQNYYSDLKLALEPPTNRRRSGSYRLSPIVGVTFNLDNIEVFEQRGKKTLRKVTWFKNGQKKHDEAITAKRQSLNPTLTFPNNQVLSVNNYTPPFFMSSDEVNKIIEEFREEILRQG